MHGEASRWQARLRSEFDAPLMVRWNEDIERFEIGQQVRSGAMDHVDWFYTVTDGKSGFRPLDHRILRKLRTLDKEHQPNWTPSRFRKFLEAEKAEVNEKRRDELRYKLMHEAKFSRGRFWRVGPEA